MNRLYEVTIMERSEFGERRPVIGSDGKEWTREMVAESAGKARYREWIKCRDYGIEFGDIRVRSLAKRTPIQHAEGWHGRMGRCNQIVHIVAKYGRHFLSENSDKREPVDDPFVSSFFTDKRNELWWIDRYTRKFILVRLNDQWPGFSDGGTLRGLVRAMAHYIETGDVIVLNWRFGPFYDWDCGGDPWGYGDDMPKVRAEALEILQQVTEPASKELLNA